MRTKYGEMKPLSAYEKDEIKKHPSADERITAKMVEMLNEAEIKERLVNWAEFWLYCYDYFELPDFVITKCIDEARKQTFYKLASLPENDDTERQKIREEMYMSLFKKRREELLRQEIEEELERQNKEIDERQKEDDTNNNSV